MKSNIGHISLIVAVSGLIITEVGIYTELLQGSFWRVLATGFEAGTIGALADWFAVSALFHRIPIPLVSRHTNIIVKNREKITEAIVELVTTQWLSSRIIRDKLQGVGMAKGIFTMLEKPRNLGVAMDLIRHLLLRFAENLDHPKFAYWAKDSIRTGIKNFDLAGPLGKWIENMIRNKDHHPIVDKLLKESVKALDDPSTRTLIQEKLKGVLKSYEKTDFIKKAAVRLGKWTGGIDIDVLTDRLLGMVRLMADEARSDPDHPLRQKFDRSLMELSRRLKEGDPSTLAFIDKIKQKIMEDREMLDMAEEAFDRLRTTVKGQLGGDKTSFMIFLRDKADAFIKEAGADDATLLRMDDWMKETIAQLINKYHPEVGNMVRENLLKLDDQELVWQIKEKVGDDLQYIRLNGAVVGGLVGIIIALGRMIFL